MYVTSSLLSAFAGILVLGRMGVGSASGVGVGWELSAIAAADPPGMSTRPTEPAKSTSPEKSSESTSGSGG